MAEWECSVISLRSFKQPFWSVLKIFKALRFFKTLRFFKVTHFCSGLWLWRISRLISAGTAICIALHGAQLPQSNFAFNYKKKLPIFWDSFPDRELNRGPPGSQSDALSTELSWDGWEFYYFLPIWTTFTICMFLHSIFNVISLKKCIHCACTAFFDTFLRVIRCARTAFFAIFKKYIYSLLF